MLGRSLMAPIVARPRRIRLSRMTASSVAERGAQLGARRYLQLREDAVEVRTDRAVREEQPLADLPVRQTVGGQPGDLQLLRRQALAGAGCAASQPLAGGAQLLPRAFGP